MAKEAAIGGKNPYFKNPFTDFFASAKEAAERRFRAYIENTSPHKGNQFFSYYPKVDAGPWYNKMAFKREEIVTINRIRSNHYNLNYSLFRKNIVDSSMCGCGESRQDINHVIFSCPLTRANSGPLLTYIMSRSPQSFRDRNVFPLLGKPTPKMCRLMLAFLDSHKIDI